MLTPTRPSDDDLRQLRDQLTRRPLSYESGLLQRLDDRAATGHWFVDRFSATLGAADNFAAARDALREWTPFDQEWTVPLRPSVELEPGAVVTYAARVLGVWWSYGCRILDVVDEPDRLAFTYGTISGHAERGEETFEVRIVEDRTEFSLFAASRPGRWFAWPGVPIARHAQRRFRVGAAAAMRRAIANDRRDRVRPPLRE